MSLTRALRKIWLDDIAKALARVGFIGNTFDFSHGSGVLPPTTVTVSLPMTSEGDILIYKSGRLQRLGIGTEGQLLTVVSGYPSWVTGTSVPTSSNTIVDDNGVPATLVDSSGATILSSN